MDKEYGLDEMLSEAGLEEVEEYSVVDNNTEADTKIDGYTPFFEEEMLRIIEEVDEYSWNRGEMGGLDWGFETLNKAFEGLNAGVHLVAGPSNVGKSGIMMQMAWQIASKNKVVSEEKPKKAFVLYFSLDDSNNELLPRFIAIDQKIPINAVRFPKKYQDNQHYMNRRKEGLKNLKENVRFIGMRDVNDGSDIEYIEETVEKYAQDLALLDDDYQIVIFVDNFHDVTVRDINFGSDSGGKYDHIADQFSRIAAKFDAPIVCSAEFRKLNGNRRPILDDIRDSVKIVYEAKAIILCYSEVGLRGQQANIFWLGDDDTKQPVFEAHIAKNKYGSFKGREFFEFIPSMSYFREVPEAASIRYTQMISG